MNIVERASGISVTSVHKGRPSIYNSRSRLDSTRKFAMCGSHSVDAMDNIDDDGAGGWKELDVALRVRA